MQRHFPALLGLAILLTGLYWNVTQSFFCGYDDYMEMHRAAFEDQRDPAGIFTKTHFGTPKYRPLGRLINYMDWQLGHGNPLVGRSKNLICHIAVMAAVYGVAWLLFGSARVAVGAALLFALKPQANQPVMAPTWQNLPANALAMGAVFFFLWSLRDQRYWGWKLAGALVSLELSLFTYESTIPIWGVVYGYLVLWLWRGNSLPRRYVASLLLATVLLLGVFFSVRRNVVKQKIDTVPVTLAAKNLAMYGFALATPIDLLWAHDQMGWPMPAQLRDNPKGVLGAAAVAGGLLLAAGIWIARQRRWARLPWLETGYLVASAGMMLAPYLVFTPHASETYVYISCALFAVALAVWLDRLFPGQWAFAVALGVLALLGLGGIWTRNGRVVACGVVGQRILGQLPLAEWKQGTREIEIIPAVSHGEGERFGIYGWRGLATIDPQEPGIASMNAAVQTFSGNEGNRVRVVNPGQLSGCDGAKLCYEVAGDGAVRAVRGNVLREGAAVKPGMP